MYSQNGEFEGRSPTLKNLRKMKRMHQNTLKHDETRNKKIQYNMQNTSKYAEDLKYTLKSFKIR